VNDPPDQRGIALVLSLIVLMTLSVLVMALMSVSSLEPAVVGNLAAALQARWLAEAGIEVGCLVLATARDPDGSWAGLLGGATAESPWVTMPGLDGAPPPGAGPPGGTWTVSIRNATGADDPAGNGRALVLRSTATFRRATRTIEVAIGPDWAPGTPNPAGASPVMSNWRER
jgi:Tfp pilus assembly protein PilX